MLNVINIAQKMRLAQSPFTLIELAAVGEIVLHGYICLGAVNWHKHIDNDEAFLVREGMMVLESEWGNVLLRANELALMPKGIAHRSGSQTSTLVVLFHARGLPERKNGHRRIYTLPGEGQLGKMRLLELATRTDPFCLSPVTSIDDYTLQVVEGNGLSPTYLNSVSDTLWLNLRGQARLEANSETVELAEGELVVVPRNVTHCWLSFGTTTFLWLGLNQVLV
jgi:mannose-6-phosphate isomerase-like protein (cupin superfamily)